MNSFPSQNNSTQNTDERFVRFFYANNRYAPLFLGVAGIGFFVIYLLTQYNILGYPSPQLLYIGGALILTAILQIPVVVLARNGKSVAASFLSTFSISLLAVLLASFWEGILLLAIIITLIAPLTSILAGLPRRYYVPLLLITGAGIAGVLYLNTYPLLAERLRTSTPAAIAGLAFLGATGLLLFTVAVITRGDAYGSLRAQLLTSFAIIVTIPAVLAIILSAVGAYVNNESQIFNVLETISKLKESQFDEVVNLIRSDADRIAQDPNFSKNISGILNPEGAAADLSNDQRNGIRSMLQDYQRAGAKNYSEILVINIGGDVVVSTNADRDGFNFSSQAFYQNGIIDDYVEFSRIPSFDDGKLIFTTPIFEGATIRGILVLRAQDGLIKSIVETTPGFPEMETYLLGPDLQPLTQTRSITQTVNTQASQALLPGGLMDGKGSYENYAGENVLGYYQRAESLNAMFISEVPQEYVLRTSLNSLLGGGVLGIFAFLIAIVAVAVSADSIARPISALARTAESFAAGELSARTSIDRRDEIGALGKAYDQMAEQLQDIIGGLEQRVADRTKALENQTGRLRASAEVARDAATSHSLSEVLNKAGALIQERFNTYHTGIFLLDSNREYAVLVASPTEAGKQMIANSHKLRIGEVGIVGRVAATGEPRITLDTGLDAVHFGNPLLPNTRSEMSLPLKIEDKIIGVLDVQSDQSQAFNEDDIAIMQILADQLAIAIERTRLLQQVEENLKELQMAYGQSTRTSWKSLAESGLLNNTGYRFDNVRIQPINRTPELGTEAMQTGGSIVQSVDGKTQVKQAVVAIPVKLRGQSIGVVTVNLKEGYSSNTISTIEQVVDRLAASLESARLFEEARLRADREQAISQVTSAISSSTDFDSILRTTVEEIGKSLGESEVSIQILSETGQE